MTRFRTLLAALALGGSGAGAATLEAADARTDPDCRFIVGGTGGAHVIREHCPERDRRVAEAVRAQLDEAQRTVERAMDRIEARIVLPPGAAPLAGYGRYYAWDSDASDRRRVIGVYARIGTFTPGRHWVAKSDLPWVLDGGCGIVTIIYDAEADRIESVACNGQA